MRTLGDTNTHFFLLKRMARATGADLSPMEEAAWSAAVTRCRSCACPGLCEAKLAAAERTGDGMTEAPGFCENRDLLRSLRR